MEEKNVAALQGYTEPQQLHDSETRLNSSTNSEL